MLMAYDEAIEEEPPWDAVENIARDRDVCHAHYFLAASGHDAKLRFSGRTPY